MSNAIEKNNNGLFKRVTNNIVSILACSAATVGVVVAGTQVPRLIRAERAFWEQTSMDREALEKHAPQVKNGDPLTVEQGIKFILQEHDNNPKDGKISITEAMDVLSRVKRYERTYAAWNESSKNLFHALMKIDKKQTK